VGVLTHRSTLGAVGAEVERAVPAGLLADPDAVRHFGHTVQPTEQCVQTGGRRATPLVFFLSILPYLADTPFGYGWVCQ
jgi:hypothetical protein